MSAGPGLAFAFIVVGLVVIALAWLTRPTDHADPDPTKETTR